MDFQDLLAVLKRGGPVENGWVEAVMSGFDSAPAPEKNLRLLCAHFAVEGRCVEAQDLEAWLEEVCRECYYEPDPQVQGRMVWCRLHQVLRTRDRAQSQQRPAFGGAHQGPFASPG